ncbi:MAG: OmpA family protein [Haliscomenobacter sp.]|nr:OmpA family protein [Haliscomenobacter sp.]
MKKIRNGLIPVLLGVVLFFAGCASLNKTQKGAITGTAAGAAIGTVVGKTAGNTALGAIIGAVVGGTAGAIIGRQMDKQAEEIKKTVPDAEVVRVEEGIIVEFSSSILFAFDMSNLSNEAKANLDKLVIVLNNYPDTDIEVQGHTDNKGSEAYNQNLSEQRASRVSAYLVSKGIAASRLTTKGLGEMLPKYANDTAEGRDNNRRVEFLITANETMKAEAEKQAGK